jgi:hypothetical protein
MARAFLNLRADSLGVAVAGTVVVQVQRGIAGCGGPIAGNWRPLLGFLNVCHFVVVRKCCLRRGSVSVYWYSVNTRDLSKPYQCCGLCVERCVLLWKRTRTLMLREWINADSCLLLNDLCVK